MNNINITYTNEYKDWVFDENKFEQITRDLFEFYLETPDIYDNSCLAGLDYKKISFDYLFCSGEKTHEINRQYREKDYPADIITFAVFADSPKEERFILDFEINLGEVIIAVDKISESANQKGIPFETELYFMISHGLMHLLGFDHRTEKEFEFVVTCQKAALQKVGIHYDKI